ncbi:hypothetical protein GCM10009539_01310 [Cryptosporangium japonicum]|uniref:TIR domain-containing protein n=1 Tax=Cryptosporangium japonicum TaxID=80872 RepID=A0ABN0TEJ5_9ACTN
MLVVVSPASSASKWVACEVRHAGTNGKPVLPLRLESGGDIMELLALHEEDVAGGRMPGPELVARLRQHVKDSRSLRPFLARIAVRWQRIALVAAVGVVVTLSLGLALLRPGDDGGTATPVGVQPHAEPSESPDRQFTSRGTPSAPRTDRTTTNCASANRWSHRTDVPGSR